MYISVSPIKMPKLPVLSHNSFTSSHYVADSVIVCVVRLWLAGSRSQASLAPPLTILGRHGERDIISRPEGNPSLIKMASKPRKGRDNDYGRLAVCLLVTTRKATQPEWPPDPLPW